MHKKKKKADKHSVYRDILLTDEELAKGLVRFDLSDCLLHLFNHALFSPAMILVKSLPLFLSVIVPDRLVS